MQQQHVLTMQAVQRQALDMLCDCYPKMTLYQAKPIIAALVWEAANQAEREGLISQAAARALTAEPVGALLPPWEE